MRVAITGSHSTGKTTLLSSCQQELHSLFGNTLSIINEVAREVIASGFPLNQEATCDSYHNYILFQLKAERQAKTEHVISDRSLIDLLAYLRTNNNPLIPSYFTNMVEEVIWLESRYFDIFCYLPIEFELIVDDVRPSDMEYQHAVDNQIQNILSEYHLPFQKITGNVSERQKKVIQLFGLS